MKIDHPFPFGTTFIHYNLWHCLLLSLNLLLLNVNFNLFVNLASFESVIHNILEEASKDAFGTIDQSALLYSRRSDCTGVRFEKWRLSLLRRLLLMPEEDWNMGAISSGKNVSAIVDYDLSYLYSFTFLWHTVIDITKWSHSYHFTIILLLPFTALICSETSGPHTARLT